MPILRHKPVFLRPPAVARPARARLVALLLLAGAAAACRAVPDEAAAAGTPVADLMYELLQGEMSGFRGDLPGAFAHYYRASLLTADPEVAARAVEIALWHQDFEGALEAAARWHAVLPDNPGPPVRVIGSIHAILGDVPAAVEAFQQSIELSPEGLALDLLHISNSLSAPGAQAVRLEVMRALARLHPTSAHAHFHVAGLARADGELEEALAAAVAANELLPGWPEAILLRAGVLRETDRGGEAVAVLRQALSGPIQHEHRLRRMLAELLHELERRGEARAEYARLLGADPHNPQLQLTLGSLALLDGDLAEARAQFRALGANARPLERGQPRAFNRSASAYYLGLLAEQAGDPAQAMRHYYRVEEHADPRMDHYYQDARLRSARLILEAEDLARARMHLRVSRGRSLRAENVVQLYVAEGDLLYGLQEYAAGFDLLSRALEKYPGEASLLYSRALLAERLGRLDWLEQDLRRVLADDPDNPQALNALGYTWADHNQNLEQALEYIERAHAQLPDDAAIIDSLGWAHYRLGNLQRAERLLRQALELQQDGEIVAHLVEVLWVRGRHEEARRLYREALDRLPDDEFLSRLARRFAL